MRKFFKSLAVLLALTLIVGVIPAAAADSLSMQKEKVLYLDGSKGQKEDGTQCKTSYKKLVANMIKGFDKDTMSVVLSSADKDIVKTTKAGRIVAKSLGTTTVTVTVFDAAEEQLFKQDLKVIVKKNATDVTVTGIADGDKVKVGQTVDVTLPRLGVDTDVRELTVDKADLVELKAGEKARTWTVKFLKAGDVTFTAKAYQSAKYPATTAKKDIKVSIANPAPTAVKAVAANAYELTFDTDVEAAGLFKNPNEIANDACYYMLNETKVTQSAVKELKAKGNTVKVTMYDNFAAGTEYFVVVNGSDPLSFTIAGTGAKDVESIAIISDTAVVNTASEVKVALYNKDGVEITSSVGLDAVTLTSTNLNSYVDGLTLNMYNVGDVTDVTATFTYYDANNNYEAVKKTATKKITAVAAASMQFVKLVYSVDATGSAASRWYGNPKSYIALGDQNYAFKCSLVYTLNGTEGEVLVDGTNLFNGHALYAKIPEESVALLSANVGTLYPITANTVGSTNVFIGYDDNNKFVTVAVAPIQVKAKRYPASLTVKASKSNLNTSAVGDKLFVNAEVKDQYGDYFDVAATDLVVNQNDQSKAIAVLLGQATTPFGRVDAGKYSFTVNGNHTDIAYAAGKDTVNVVFTTKVNRNDAQTPVPACSFTAKDAGTQVLETQQISFVNEGAASLDTTITGNTELKKASLHASSSSNGYFTGDIDLDEVTVVPTTDNVFTSWGATTGVAFELLTKKNGTVTTLAGLGAFAEDDIDNGKLALNNFVYGNDPLVKLDKGTYTFTVYKIYKKGAEKSTIVISSQTVVVNVTDNQTYPTFTQLKESVGTGSLDDCFKFSFSGTDYNTAAGGYDKSDASDATNAVFVRKATITANITLKDKTGAGRADSATHFNLDCTINKLIKK